MIKQIHYPQNSWIRNIVPIVYIISLQLVTGIPNPGLLERLNAYEIAINLSAELYNYPFWLQDLSHFPLFFLLTWFSYWIISKNSKSCRKFCNIKVMLFSISYAFFNEGIQAIIPERFPSLGDLIMNLAGVLTALFVYRLTHDKIIQEK
tara:strand:- start:487 stop:933 length:447 start_codon:yes stop_codon:yes gene_type:complete